MSSKSAIRTALFSIIGSAVLAVIKGLTGILGNSYALIADAIESTTDIFSSILVLIGLKYSSRPADENHPYGHGKAEALVTFMIVAFLVGSAGIIVYQSIENLQTPHELPKPFTLYVLGGIILFKEFSYQYVRRKGKEANSTSLQADAVHHRADAITSLAAFIGISIALIGGKGYEVADDWAALLAAAVILFNAYNIFRPALAEIMDEHLYDEEVTKIREIAKTVKGVRNTEKCLIRKAGMKYLVDLHARVDGNITVYEGHDISHRLKDCLMKQMPELADVLVHIEPE